MCQSDRDGWLRYRTQQSDDKCYELRLVSPQYFIHFCKLVGHGGMVRTVTMTTMVDAKKVSDYHRPIIFSHFWQQISYHSLVHSMEILYIEGRK